MATSGPYFVASDNILPLSGLATTLGARSEPVWTFDPVPLSAPRTALCEMLPEVDHQAPGLASIRCGRRLVVPVHAICERLGIEPPPGQVLTADRLESLVFGHAEKQGDASRDHR